MQRRWAGWQIYRSKRKSTAGEESPTVLLVPPRSDAMLAARRRGKSLQSGVSRRSGDRLPVSDRGQNYH